MGAATLLELMIRAITQAHYLPCTDSCVLLAVAQLVLVASHLGGYEGRR
jgi:hypothetical protein